MMTRNRLIVILILMLVVLITSWSRLRHVDANDYEPQRIPIGDASALPEGRLVPNSA